MKRNSLLSRVVFLAVALAGCRRDAQSSALPAPERPAAAIPASVGASRRTPVVVAVHTTLPSVVNIQSEATIRQREVNPFFGIFGGGGDRAYRTQSLGSGFVWASDGIIVTNAHVIEGASRITVNFQDGRQASAQVLGVDPDSDLAVLHVDAKNLVPAPLGSSSDLLIGETVIAVGNPFGLSGSVTTGVVSATGRSVPSKERNRTFTDFIQTDASINPGNSGGPLLNIEGRVIGINTAIYAEAQGIGFAIPVDRARKIVEDLRKYGEVHAAWIGVGTATVTPEEGRRRGLQATHGALVTRVFGGSPAERAGIRRGDVIVGVADAPVESRESFTTLTATAAGGSTLRLRVQRGGETLVVPVTATEPPKDLGLQVLSAVSGVEVTQGDGAVVIRGVRSGTRAAAIGLAEGDYIVAVNGSDVRTVRELNDRVASGADRSSIVLSVARGQFIYTLTFPIGSDQGADQAENF
ncbi:MAG TPA: trypsin-like peptidase domain-containing protein [Thermoanaerobaculia bacterium]|nr:trypsin-like peptidase domain-containing protein [Thermoanaerobaculia bacterium]